MQQHVPQGDLSYREKADMRHLKNEPKKLIACYP